MAARDESSRIPASTSVTAPEAMTTAIMDAESPRPLRNGRGRRHSSEDSTSVDALLIGMRDNMRPARTGANPPPLSTSTSTSSSLPSQLLHKQMALGRTYGSDGSSTALSSLTKGTSSDEGDAALYMIEEQQQSPFAAGTSRFHISDKIWVSAIANLSTAYNLAVINYALMMIRQTYPASSPQLTSMVASCSLVGAIMGQLTFGYIGDAIGRKRAMIVTLLLSIGGALASAVLPWGVDSIYYTLAICRFVLGLGVGGVYPLSATTASEATHDALTNSKIVAAVFSFQGLGQLLAPVVAFGLLETRIAHTLGWRLLLAAGALPGLFVLARAFRAKEAPAPPADEICGPGLWNALASDAELRRKLVGAALGWFLFDITFYGNVLFTPIILEDVFGFSQKHLRDVAKCSVVVALVALPGYVATVLTVGRVNFKTIQVQGFAAMALLFAGIGAGYDALLGDKMLLLALYALTFFFANFGPNVSTFCLPAEIFPPNTRVKLNGIAAASGKIGATVGAACFGMIEKECGVAFVLELCALVSLAGAIVTLQCIPGKKYGRGT